MPGTGLPPAMAMAFSTAAPPVIPITIVAKPAGSAAATACSDPGESSALAPVLKPQPGGKPPPVVVPLRPPRPPAPLEPPQPVVPLPPLPLGAQFGCPSVASIRYFGFESVSDFMYLTALLISERVGVPI